MEVKMDLSEFKLMVNELELIESNKIREKFINEFVQINSKYYKEHIYFKTDTCSASANSPVPLHNHHFG